MSRKDELTFRSKIFVNGIKVGGGKGGSVLTVGQSEIVLNVESPVAKQTSCLILDKKD
jgi:hypothetical protein